MFELLGSKRILLCFAILCTWGVLLLIALHFLNFSSENKAKIIETQAPPVSVNSSCIRTTTLFPANVLNQSQTNDTSSLQNPSNVPKPYWDKDNQRWRYKNKSCAKYPRIVNLDLNNIYWQVMHSRNGTFYLFHAYYDKRNYSYPAVRILAMIDRYLPKVETLCLFWFRNISEPIIGKVPDYTYAWYKLWGNTNQGILQPYLISCPIPDLYKSEIPESVSIVEDKCETASNNLGVFFKEPEKKEDFAVCVKGLDFLNVDVSVRLVEWIELLRILGADKIFFYVLEVHPNVSKVLRHYKETGFVEVTPLTLPGGQPNYPWIQHLYLAQYVLNKRQNELIPYNDCFYKNMYSFRYIVLLDFDEVIVPKKELSWKSLIEKTINKSNNKPISSFCARNVYFFDFWTDEHGWFNHIPRYMHILQHVYRSGNFSRPWLNVKCFNDPSRILTLHNHMPLHCVNSTYCSKIEFELEEAQLNHYRKDCHYQENCQQYYQAESVMDLSVMRFQYILVPRTVNTLRTLGYFDSSK